MLTVAGLFLFFFPERVCSAQSNAVVSCRPCVVASRPPPPATLGNGVTQMGEIPYSTLFSWPLKPVEALECCLRIAHRQ